MLLCLYPTNIRITALYHDHIIFRKGAEVKELLFFPEPLFLILSVSLPITLILAKMNCMYMLLI